MYNSTQYQIISDYNIYAYDNMWNRFLTSNVQHAIYVRQVTCPQPFMY